MENSNQNPSEKPTEDSDQEKDSVKSGLVDVEITPEALSTQQILEKEIGTAKIIDMIIHQPFNLMFQTQLLDAYESKIINPLLGVNGSSANLDGGRQFLREEFDNLDIKKNYHKVLSSAEKIAQEKGGYKEPLQKKLGKQSLYIMLGTMALYFIIMSIPTLQAYGNYIMIPLFMVLCFLPQYLRRSLQSKWVKFKKDNYPQWKEENAKEIETLHRFVQDLLDDSLERLLANRYPLQGLQFALFSGDYNNIKVIRSQVLQGDPQYIVQFEYPEGVEPFEVSSAGSGVVGSGKVATQASATETGAAHSSELEDDLDLFILLRDPTFTDDGKIKEGHVEYPAQSQYPVIIELLEDAKFNDVNNPTDVFDDFYSNERIKCTCGRSVHFEEMKWLESQKYSPFEFYLLVGRRCQCGLNPFILVNSPGNKEVPAQLFDLF